MTLTLAACSHDSAPTRAAPAPAPATAPAPAAALAPAAGTARPAGPRCLENFTTFDANGDGEVTEAEFMARPHWRGDAAQIFFARDANGDGVLTQSEFCSAPRGRR